MKKLNDGIKEIIEMFSYPFYIVQQDKSFKCTCTNPTTGQADGTCPLCLGTGYKIQIRKIKGVSFDSKASFRDQGLDEQTLSCTYYVDAKYPIFKDNLIIDNNNVRYVYRTEYKYSSNKEMVYIKASVHEKKTNPKKILENFYRLIGGGRP